MTTIRLNLASHLFGEEVEITVTTLSVSTVSDATKLVTVLEADGWDITERDGINDYGSMFSASRHDVVLEISVAE